MKEISILRHAKSSWDNRNLSDFERPLAKRGIKDAKKLNALLLKNNFNIDKVFCSKALRAKETFDLTADGFNFPIEDATYSDDLYFGDTNNIINFLQDLDDKYKNVLIIGHNPTLHMLIESLTGKYIERFTTCNLAVISFKGEWKRLSSNKSSLKLLIRPKEIET